MPASVPRAAVTAAPRRTGARSAALTSLVDRDSIKLGAGAGSCQSELSCKPSVCREDDIGHGRCCVFEAIGCHWKRLAEVFVEERACHAMSLRYGNTADNPAVV